MVQFRRLRQQRGRAAIPFFGYRLRKKPIRSASRRAGVTMDTTTVLIVAAAAAFGIGSHYIKYGRICAGRPRYCGIGRTVRDGGTRGCVPHTLTTRKSGIDSGKL